MKTLKSLKTSFMAAWYDLVDFVTGQPDIAESRARIDDLIYGNLQRARAPSIAQIGEADTSAQIVPSSSGSSMDDEVQTNHPNLMMDMRGDLVGNLIIFSDDHSNSHLCGRAFLVCKQDDDTECVLNLNSLKSDTLNQANKFWITTTEQFSDLSMMRSIDHETCDIGNGLVVVMMPEDIYGLLSRSGIQFDHSHNKIIHGSSSINARFLMSELLNNPVQCRRINATPERVFEADFKALFEEAGSYGTPAHLLQMHALSHTLH